jgi:hypothetical protein
VLAVLFFGYCHFVRSCIVRMQMVSDKISYVLLHIVSVATTHYRSWGLLEVEASRVSRQSAREFTNVSHKHRPHLPPPPPPPGNISGIHFCLRLWVDPRTIVRAEGLSQWKIPVTSWGIEPATVRLVTNCLNQMRHRVSSQHTNIYDCFGYTVYLQNNHPYVFVIKRF